VARHMDKASRDPVLVAAAWVAGIAAAVASWSALYGLALRTGWSHWTAPLFPMTVDAYAVAALRVWLGRATPSRSARTRARRNAVLAIAASMAGNAVIHAAVAGDFRVTWPVVVAVSAVPPVTLGLVSHLFALRSQPAENAPAPLPEVPPNGALAKMAKAEAIRLALAHNDGKVIAAQQWLAERGVQVDRAYAHDVKAGRSGRRPARRTSAERPAEVAA
jgi:Protein of unknown function (DUF2637)